MHTDRADKNQAPPPDRWARARRWHSYSIFKYCLKNEVCARKFLSKFFSFQKFSVSLTIPSDSLTNLLDICFSKRLPMVAFCSDSHFWLFFIPRLSWSFFSLFFPSVGTAGGDAVPQPCRQNHRQRESEGFLPFSCGSVNTFPGPPSKFLAFRN